MIEGTEPSCLIALGDVISETGPCYTIQRQQTTSQLLTSDTVNETRSARQNHLAEPSPNCQAAE